MSLTFRFLDVADLSEFRAVRLRALKEHPDAFLVSYEEASLWSDEKFKSYLTESTVAGAFEGEKLVGITALWRHQGHKTNHRADIWGVYVAPEARGHGAGKRLLEMLIAEAKTQGIEMLLLSTDVTNPLTINLYESVGFTRYGVDEHILKLQDGRYVDDVLMRLNLLP